MKNTFTFLLVSIITISLVGQSNFYPTNNLKSTQVIKHLMDSTIYEVYYEEDEEWHLKYKQDFIYDENLNMLESSWYYMRNSQWEFTDITEFTYDEDGLITLRLESYWDDNSGDIVINYKEEYTYNDDDQLTLMVETNWNTNVNEWELTYKKEYYYNENEDISYTHDYHWEDDIEDWENGDSAIYTYDANAYLELILLYEWDNDNGIWKENTKKEFTNDDDGNVTSRIISYMNYNTNEWSIYSKREYTYDGSANPQSEIYSYWEDSKGYWDEDRKYEYSYNLEYELSDMILPPLFYFNPDYYENITNMPIDYMEYNAYFGGSWSVTDRITYFYSEQEVTGFSNLSESSVEIYPNPTSGIINFRMGINFQQISFELIDMQGKRVMQQKISNNQKVDIRQLPKGLYFYKISCNKESLYSGKIIIK